MSIKLITQNLEEPFFYIISGIAALRDGCGVMGKWGSGVWGVGCGVMGRINKNNLLLPFAFCLLPFAFVIEDFFFLRVFVC
ncbi:MAG: hypothetical protein DWQ56_05225 [Microcystis aeruginosa DA14]|uniref:Uncharacterized protein n=1 Tax=Microcystis aeruginosa DA14 TaxID=1987506 RepID=A0A3E0MNT7_MICAE|nr:MAG: hypothetical protein DWQ56_05225 [Microcystis aeruginosa DA14]